MTIKLDDFTRETIREQNPNWPGICNHPYRISITGSSRFDFKCIT